MEIGDAYIINSDVWLAIGNEDLFWVDVKPDGLDNVYVSKDSILIFDHLFKEVGYNFNMVEPGFSEVSDSAEFNMDEINKFMTKIR